LLFAYLFMGFLVRTKNVSPVALWLQAVAAVGRKTPDWNTKIACAAARFRVRHLHVTSSLMV
jgi:hypothetical protein